MARLPSVPSLSNLDEDEFKRYTAIAISDLQSVINGQVDFGSNIRSQTVEVSFTTANADVPVNHNLGRIPTGYILIKSNAAASIYSVTDATATILYLRSSSTCQATIIIV